MSLDRLVEEIRSRGEAELHEVEARLTTESKRIEQDRDRRVEEIGREAERQAEREATRERTQRVAAAKLHSRQKLYEAREARLENGLLETRELLLAYTATPKYAETLKRMFERARAELGNPVVVRGRAEDKALLRKVAGDSYRPEPQPIVGGLVAETPDGHRRLNLSFDSLLRLREDRVRALLS